MPTTRPRRVPRTAAPDPNSRAATTPPASTPPARDSLDRRDLVLAISPFERPDARVTAAAVRDKPVSGERWLRKQWEERVGDERPVYEDHRLAGP